MRACRLWNGLHLAAERTAPAGTPGVGRWMSEESETVLHVRWAAADAAAMKQSWARRRVAFCTRHQAARTLRADPVRSLGARGRAGRRGLRLPVSRDAAHTFAPRALRDPSPAVATDFASRRRASSRSLLLRTRVEIDARG